MKAVDDFARLKQEGRKISMVTAYDAWSARLVARSDVDAILVGDSAAMVIHGHSTTLAATVELMAIHTRVVASAAAGKFLIADLPFLSFRKGIPAAMKAVSALVTSGAQSVKLEGVAGHEDVILPGWSRSRSVPSFRMSSTRCGAAAGSISRSIRSFSRRASRPA